MPVQERKLTRSEWLRGRFLKWSRIILQWFGVFMIAIFIHWIFFLQTIDFKYFIAIWVGMFGQDILYQLKFVTPYDREKLIIEFKENRKHI